MRFIKGLQKNDLELSLNFLQERNIITPEFAKDLENILDDTSCLDVLDWRFNKLHSKLENSHSIQTIKIYSSENNWLYLRLVYATAYLKKYNSEDEQINLKVYLLKDILHGIFRSNNQALTNLVKSYNENPDIETYLPFMQIMLISAVDRVYANNHYIHTECKNIAKIVHAINNQYILKAGAAYNLASIIAPYPLIKDLYRSTIRLLIGPVTLGLRNGFGLAVSLVIGIGLFQVAFPKIDLPAFKHITSMAIGLGCIVFMFTALIGFWQKYKKGKLQTLLAKNSEEIIKAYIFNCDRENVYDNKLQLMEFIRQFDLKYNILSLKRRQYLHATDNAASISRISAAITPIAHFGARPDLVVGLFTSGIEELPARILKKYWYQDELYNKYIDNLGLYTKVKTDESREKILKDILKLTLTINFLSIFFILSKHQLNAPLLELLTNLDILISFSLEEHVSFKKNVALTDNTKEIITLNKIFNAIGFDSDRSRQVVDAAISYTKQSENCYTVLNIVPQDDHHSLSKSLLTFSYQDLSCANRQQAQLIPAAPSEPFLLSNLIKLNKAF